MAAPPSPQLNAALAGRYEIVRELGAGGMATVYLARDLRHDRHVALKVLKPELGAVLGVERFLSEIRVTANLQHPNILPLFDSGEAEGLLFYVMPFVDGETLRARLTREKQLPVADAVRIATAIGGALQYAHRHGVIHRDLKPENVLLHEGQPLIADFGIALAVSNAGGTRITQTGLSLGTPQYMSPEQATGDRAIDGRTDIYSLGAVLYEMFAGDPPHTGSTAQAIIAHLLTEQPRSVRAARAAVPEHVADAVEVALAKLPADRWSTAQEFVAALEAPGAATHAPTRSRARRSRTMTVALTALASGVAIGATAATVYLSGRTAGRGGSGPARFAFTLGDDKIVLPASSMSSMAISRDGRLVAAVAAMPSAPSAIYLRSLSEPRARLLEGTEGADQPFFSPDGKWIAFIAGRKLMKVKVEGGTPVPVVDVLNGSGATWVTNDQLVYEMTSRLAVIPASGGAPRLLGALDSARGEVEQRWPVALPDGNTILYSSSTGSLPTSHLGIATVSDGRSERLDIPGTAPLGYVDGAIVYVAPEGTLMAVPFDLHRRHARGAPVALADHIWLNPIGAANAALAPNGTLLYQPGSPLQNVVLRDSAGHEQQLPVQPAAYTYPRLSPDGKRIALTVGSRGRSDVWIYTIADATLARLTSEGGLNERPEWSPDGSTVIYRSDQGGRSAIWKRPADASAPAAPLLSIPGAQIWEAVFSPDGQALVYRTGAIGRGDIFYRRLFGDTTPHAIAASRFGEWHPRVSPDGRWVAYASDEAGTYQVYVQPFPGPGARVQISTDGGGMPVWSRDGKRLYYAVDENLIAATLSFGGSVAVTKRTKVMTANFLVALNRGHAVFDVTADGGLLFVKPTGESQMMMVLNWEDELRAALAKPGTT